MAKKDKAAAASTGVAPVDGGPGPVTPTTHLHMAITALQALISLTEDEIRSLPRAEVTALSKQTGKLYEVFDAKAQSDRDIARAFEDISSGLDMLVEALPKPPRAPRKTAARKEPVPAKKTAISRRLY